MKQHVSNKTRSILTISPETDRRLDILKAHLNSPKAWIVRRLVDEELDKLRIDPSKKLKLEVRA